MKPKLLIVEDNELTSSLLYTIFDSLGFDVAEISHGNDVLPYLSKNKIDVMILDLELPGMTGDQIYAAMKNDAALSSIPVIPFTAHSNSQSPDSFSSKVIWAEYQKSGKIPTIIYKFEESGESRKITKEIIDEVTRRLCASQFPLPQPLIDYYSEVRGGTPQSVLDR